MRRSIVHVQRRSSAVVLRSRTACPTRTLTASATLSPGVQNVADLSSLMHTALEQANRQLSVILAETPSLDEPLRALFATFQNQLTTITRRIRQFLALQVHRLVQRGPNGNLLGEFDIGLYRPFLVQGGRLSESAVGRNDDGEVPRHYTFETVWIDRHTGESMGERFNAPVASHYVAPWLPYTAASPLPTTPPPTQPRASQTEEELDEEFRVLAIRNEEYDIPE